MARLAGLGIETKLLFYSVHQLPTYRALARGESCSVADRLVAEGISLPCSATLLEGDVACVCRQVAQIVARSKGDRQTFAAESFAFTFNRSTATYKAGDSAGDQNALRVLSWRSQVALK